MAFVVAVAVQPHNARGAIDQDWSPFVLVAGLLLIGLVADGDGLFAGAGRLVARTTRSPLWLFAGGALMVGVVTALLNLDTSVAFLTPVLIYAARSQRADEVPLLYGAILLSNAGSLLLPGSNLTNLIVAGHLHLTGSQLLARMWAPDIAALLITSVVLLVGSRWMGGDGELSISSPPDQDMLFGLGVAAVVIAAVTVVALRSPALPVVVVGLVVVSIRMAAGRVRLAQVTEVVGAPVLVGLFGVAVALGTLGRAWSGPSNLLAHLDAWETAGVAALATVLVNNLPAASLLAARSSPHPLALLAGLNLGPNLWVTGSLAWVLWWRAARGTGARPSIARAGRLGVVAAPLSLAAAVGLLVASGHA